MIDCKSAGVVATAVTATDDEAALEAEAEVEAAAVELDAALDAALEPEATAEDDAIVAFCARVTVARTACERAREG